MQVHSFSSSSHISLEEIETAKKATAANLLKRIEEYAHKSFYIYQTKDGFERWLRNQMLSKTFFTYPVASQNVLFSIYWDSLGGFGDTMFALKTAASLKKHFPDTSISLYGGKIPEILEPLVKDLGLQDCIGSSIGDVPEDVLQFKLLVGTPDRLKPDTESIYYFIDEYNGWRAKHTVNHFCFNSIEEHSWFSAGIGRAIGKKRPAVGIHINPSLAYPKKDLAKLKRLKNVPLRSELLYSLEKNPKSHFYFAYNSDGGPYFLYRFIRATILSEKDNWDPLQFVVVNSNHYDITDLVREFMEGFEWNRYKHKVHKIKINILNGGMAKKKYTRKTGHLVNIIFTPPVLPEDMLLLMKTSEGPTQVSGDQSFAELISMCDKIPFYQQQEWKKELVRELQLLAKEMFGETSIIAKFLGNLFHYPDCFDDEGCLTTDFKEYLKEEEEIIERLSKYMMHPDLKKELKRFFRYISEFYNIEEWLIGDIKKKTAEHIFPNLKIEGIKFMETPCLPKAIHKFMNVAFFELEKQKNSGLKKRRVK